MLCRVGGRNWGGIVPLPKINWRYKVDGRSTEAELRRLVRNTNAYIRRHNAKLPKNVLPVKTYSFKELRNNITTRKEFNQYVSEFKSLRNKNAFDIVETDNFTTVKFNENLYKTLLNRMNMKTAEEAKEIDIRPESGIVKSDVDIMYRERKDRFESFRKSDFERSIAFYRKYTREKNREEAANNYKKIYLDQIKGLLGDDGKELYDYINSLDAMTIYDKWTEDAELMIQFISDPLPTDLIARSALEAWKNVV